MGVLLQCVNLYYMCVWYLWSSEALELCVVAQAFNSSTPEAGAETRDLCEFQARLMYIVSSRTVKRALVPWELELQMAVSLLVGAWN